MRFKFLIALIALFLATPHSAHAKPEFVDALQKATDAPCLPQCNICHASVTGGGEVVQPFGQSMGEVGSEEFIQWAVDQLEQQNVDSDGDGVGDIEEIREGQDPNYAGDALICQPDVGCGAHIAPTPSRSDRGQNAALTTLVLLVGLGFRRVSLRRKRSTRQAR